MNLVNIKIRLQKSNFGRFIINIYHYCIAVPYSIYILKYKLMKKNIKNIKFYTSEELFSKLKNEKYSLSRFGDGEIS